MICQNQALYSSSDNCNCKNSDEWFNDCKNKAFLLYKKYIEPGCRYEINLSFRTRNIISQLMKNDS